MSKIYLVDSENIGASWSQLLQTMSQEDKMFVFYTDKSPYISYDNLLQVIAYYNVPVFIKCYEGKNALDFQLVSELGFKLCQEPEAEFIIISDDYGYDAAVKYWKERSYNVHRIGKKYCKPATPRKTEVAEVVHTVTEKVTEVVAEPVVEKLIRELPREAKTEDTVFEEQTVSEEQFQVEEPVSAEEHQMEEEVTSGEPQVEETIASEEVLQTAEQEQFAEPISSKEQTQSGEQAGHEAQSYAESEPEAVHQDSLNEKKAQKRVRDHGRKRRKEPAGLPETEAETDVIKEERQKEEQQQKEEHRDPLELLLPEITSKCGSTEPEKDAYCVWEVFHSLSMSNLTNVNTALKMLLGNEMGNDIYRELKENQECRVLLDALYFPELKNRFIQYAQIVLERNDVTGMTAEEIGQFLLNIPRKNLNSIRAAIIKKYGQEQGSMLYTVFKPHIKVLNKI